MIESLTSGMIIKEGISEEVMMHKNPPECLNSSEMNQETFKC